MTFWQRVRILPLLVIVAMLSFAVRLGEFATGLAGSGIAFAQEEVDEPVPPMPDKNAAEEKTDAKAEAKLEDKKTEGTAHAEEKPAAAEGESAAEAKPAEDSPEWRDASETEYEHSEVRAELFRDLSKRREQIAEQEKALSAREALLLAAERELDAKLRELTALRTEIEGLLKQQSDEEKARIASLVLVYENMKAKDAARVFNTLDMDVLLEVMSAMSERKIAPIMAEMNPERARAVTVLLSQKDKLPELPPQ
jgi:flagellar motility protein MotE (MotC chaperone)